MYQNTQLCNDSGDKNKRPIKINYEGNKLIRGVDSGSFTKLITIRSSTVSTCNIFTKDNIPDGTDTPTDLFKATVDDQSGTGINESIRPVKTENFSAFPSSETYNYVLANAGARPAFRNQDYTDNRLVQTLINDTGMTPDCVGSNTFPYSYPYTNGMGTYATCNDWNKCCAKNAGGWPKIVGQTKKFVPVSNPHALHSNSSGYTNIEVQLHSLAKYVEEGL